MSQTNSKENIDPEQNNQMLLHTKIGNLKVAKQIDLNIGWDQIYNTGVSRLHEYLLTGNVRGFNCNEKMELYTLIHDMCTQKSGYAEELQEKYSNTIKEYLNSHVFNNVKELNGKTLLREVAKQWSNHKIMTKWMSKFFCQLDRQYVKQNATLCLSMKSLSIFKECIYDKIKTELKDSFLEEKQAEREGQEINQETLKSIVEMQIELGLDSNLSVYENDLEKEVIEQSKIYFMGKSIMWKNDNAMQTQLILSENLLDLEEKNQNNYLHINTLKKIMTTFDNEILINHKDQLLEQNTGIMRLFEDSMQTDISRSFKLFSRIENEAMGLEPLALAQRKQMISQGEIIVNNHIKNIMSKSFGKNDDPELIKSLILLDQQFKQVTKDCFKDHLLFQKAQSDAFEFIMNDDKQNKFTHGEILATFIDKLLRKVRERLSDDELNEKCEHCISLFQYLTDKDLFAEVQRRQLGNRLLLNTSSSDFIENEVIRKLKMKCGPHFTMKLEGMMSDLEVAKETDIKFQDYNKKDIIPTTTQILSQSHWPSFKLTTPNINKKFLDAISMFELFYKSFTKNRTIKYVYGLSTVIISAKLTKANYEIQGNVHQVSILMLFNDKKQQTQTEIKFLLNIDDEQLKRELASVTVMKYKILDKNSNIKKITNEDIFKLNDKFISPKIRIVLPPPPQEEIQVKERVTEDRSQVIEACIVRIMKSRKKLEHNELLELIIKSCNDFKPQVNLIKNKIESLIEREFLERDDNNKSLYKYLA